MKLLSQWAVTSAALILIVLAVRYLFRRKLSARLRYALWAVVLVRLLVPFQVTLPTSVSDFLPLLASNLAPEVADVELYALRTSSRPMPEEHLQELRDLGRETGDVLFYETTYLTTIAGHDLESNTHCYVLSAKGIDRYFFYTTLPKFLIALWVIGTAVTARTVFRSNRYFFGRLKYYRHPLEDVDSPIPVYTAANVPSPCLFGVFRPAVYVTPEAAENPDTLRHVLAHELTHYKHKDHIWSLLRCLALALHWYNPLVWLAVVLSKRDGELACDEGAIARLGEAERIPYGRTLVDTVAARSVRPVDLLSCSTAMTGGTKSIQQRVAQLVKHPKTAETALFATAVVVALSVVFVFAQRGQPDSTSTMFFDHLNRATAIQYGPPLYSSHFYADAIADDDLLAEAKEILSTFVFLDEDGPQPDLSPQKLIHENRIVLTFAGGEMHYSLLRQNGRTYLFPGSIWEQSYDLRQKEGETAQLISVSGTCVSDTDVISILEDLARRQMDRTNETRRKELEENHIATSQILAEALENCEQICFMDGSYPDIMDPALLAKAKDILTSGYLIDSMNQTGQDGDNETIELRDRDGQRLSSFLITNQGMRQALHELTQPQTTGNLTQAQIDQANLASTKQENPQPAERYYEANSLPLFGIEFSQQNEDSQRTNLEQLYANGDFSFFSTAVNGLDENSPLIASFAERAYQDGKIAFFSILANRMTEAELKTWLDSALEDDKWNFQSMLFDKLDMKDAKDKQEEKWAEQQMAEYRAAGITYSGKNCYYRGELVNIFLDIRPNRSFYTLDMNPAGTVNIKILRGEDGQITGVTYMTEEEAAELLADTGNDTN